MCEMNFIWTKPFKVKKLWQLYWIICIVFLIASIRDINTITTAVIETTKMSENAMDVKWVLSTLFTFCECLSKMTQVWKHPCSSVPPALIWYKHLFLLCVEIVYLERVRQKISVRTEIKSEKSAEQTKMNNKQDQSWAICLAGVRLGANRKKKRNRSSDKRKDTDGQKSEDLVRRCHGNTEWTRTVARQSMSRRGTSSDSLKHIPVTRRPPGTAAVTLFIQGSIRCSRLTEVPKLAFGPPLKHVQDLYSSAIKKWYKCR